MTNIDDRYILQTDERGFMSVQSVFTHLRQPEYTGENRCIPCTIVNSAIALLVCIALAVLVQPPAAGIGAAIVFAAIAVLTIGLRGYLVPGTPTLTKRYFPDRLLALFDKEPVTPVESVSHEDADTEAFEPEQVLLETGLLEPCADRDDLCLEPSFRNAWQDHRASLDESAEERAALAEALEFEGEIEFTEYDDAFTAYVDGQWVGQWESHAAFVADLAAARELPNWIEDWESFDVAHQGALIRGLRVFIEACPSCDGPVIPTQETVESCCREHTVLAIACENCEARLFETVADQAG